MTTAKATTPSTIPTPLAKLREKFPKESTGKLPRVTQKDGPKSKCAECKNYLPPHVHLDYVGHAAVTARLLDVDPEWNWEPLAFNEHGEPFVGKDTEGNLTLWIRLTVCGITRVGVGTCRTNASDPLKQLISDALRNVAMRFGVALDLWSKEDIAPDLAPRETAPVQAEPTATPQDAPEADEGVPAAGDTPQPEPAATPEDFWVSFAKMAGIPRGKLLRKIREFPEGKDVVSLDGLSIDDPAAKKLIEWAEQINRDADEQQAVNQ